MKPRFTLAAFLAFISVVSVGFAVFAYVFYFEDVKEIRYTALLQLTDESRLTEELAQEGLIPSEEEPPYMNPPIKLAEHHRVTYMTRTGDMPRYYVTVLSHQTQPGDPTSMWICLGYRAPSKRPWDKTVSENRAKLDRVKKRIDAAISNAPSDES
jgi:hypothetical protein